MNITTKTEERFTRLANVVKDELYSAYSIGYRAGVESIPALSGYDKYVEQGRREAFEAMKWIHSASVENLVSVFGSVRGWINYTVDEVINKINEFEEDDICSKVYCEAKVGDMVEMPDGSERIILRIQRFDDIEGKTKAYFDCFSTADGFSRETKVKLTGESYPEMAEILLKMQKDKEI